MSEKFDVFISYSRDDACLAERISRRVRRYVPPKRAGLDKRRLTIVRDTERFTAASDVQSELAKWVQAADKLVLLCSPAAGQSEYVDVEVKAFLQSRERDSIIFILCGGELAESLPASLAEQEIDPLFIDLRNASSKTFRNESLRLIAAVFDVDYTELWRVDEGRRRRRWYQAILIGALLVFALASAYLIATTPPDAWVRIPQPDSTEQFAWARGAMPVHEIAVSRKDPSIILYRGRNAWSETVDGATQEVEFGNPNSPVASDDWDEDDDWDEEPEPEPEHKIFTNGDANQIVINGSRLEHFQNDAEFWERIVASPDWVTYAPPERNHLGTIHEPGDEDEVWTELRAIVAEVPDVEDRESLVTVLKEDYAWDYLTEATHLSTSASGLRAEVIELSYTGERGRGRYTYPDGRDWFVRLGLAAQWAPLRVPSEDIVCIWPLGFDDGLVLTGDQGFFRTRDGGLSWSGANYNETGFTAGNKVKTIVVDGALATFALIDRGTRADDGENPLFRLGRRNWIERWRLGLIRLLHGKKRCQEDF